MIWVVTDHHGVRQLLVPLISSKGYPVLEINCGGEVLKRLQFTAPAAIILDCGVEDSFDTLKSLRAQVRNSAIPVVMFSTDDQNLQHRALLCGANAYIPKGSLDWAELLVEIVRFAGPPPAAEEARPLP